MAITSITPFLWFESQAEEAASFYVSLFDNSRITHVSHYGDAGPGAKGSVMVVAFELLGRRFTALNGGPRTSWMKRFRCSSIARIRRTSTVYGISSVKAAPTTCAAGLKIASASPGRSTMPGFRI